MAFPVRPPSGVRSHRVFIAGASLTADFADRAYDFAALTNGPRTLSSMPTAVPEVRTIAGSATAGSSSPMGAAPVSPMKANLHLPRTEQAEPAPALHVANIYIINLGSSDLEFSFDGTNVHGVVQAGKDRLFRNRYEGGIAVRYASGGSSGAFRIEGW